MSFAQTFPDTINDKQINCVVLAYSSTTVQTYKRICGKIISLTIDFSHTLMKYAYAILSHTCSSSFSGIASLNATQL